MTTEGIKTSESDSKVTQKFVDLHLEIGIDAMSHIEKDGEQIKHFTY
jgi:AMP nucleosidase